MTEREIFLAVLDLPDPAARAQYLNAACSGDPARRARIESLLLSHDTAGSFLGSPAIKPPQTDTLATQGFGGVATPDDDANEADADLKFLAAPRRPDSLGRIGHYEVLEVLGRGGFGIVFRAFDETLQRVVAVKVMAPQIAATSPARKRFVREARSSAKIRHENVVQIYAVEEQPLPYLVMEFIPGETLQQRINRTGPLETGEVVRIGRQIAEGLAAAHDTGLIHRDIKPANILIEAGSHPCVKITDFGLARAADDASLTQSGCVAGTPMFMAPEQARGEKLDHRADLFSLGSVLYTMCSGRPPFRANSTLAVLKRVAEDTPRPIPEIIPETPPWLCDLIARLHAKKPEDRFASAQEVADLLARYLTEPPCPGNGPALPDAPPAAVEKMPSPREIPKAAPPLRRPRFRTRRWAAAAAVLLMLLGGLGFTEATGVSNFRGTVIRLFSPEGTLVVEVDDPEVSVKIDGSELIITGAGAKEIRLKPGDYTVKAHKDGKLVRQELVSVMKNGRQVVRISQEAPPPDAKAAKRSADASAWERSVAAMPAAEQVKAVAAHLKELNPGFDGKVEPTVEDGVVTGLKFLTDHVSDISPVRGLTKLRSLNCDHAGKGLLIDLSPLRGLPLTNLRFPESPVSDLSPLKGMSLTSLNCLGSEVTDLRPLKGMPLTHLDLWTTKVSDLSPLKGMPLTQLVIGYTRVTDLSPLEGLPLVVLWLPCTQVTDLTPLKGMKLNVLDMRFTPVTNLAALQGMPLKDLMITGALAAYQTDCYVSRAGAGPVDAAGRFGDKDRSRLREQALDWLRNELASRTRQLESGQPADRAAAKERLRHWQQSTEIVGIREEAALAKLPAAERAAFKQLWADVAALLKKAEERPK